MENKKKYEKKWKQKTVVVELPIVQTPIKDEQESKEFDLFVFQGKIIFLGFKMNVWELFSYSYAKKEVLSMVGFPP